VVPPPPPPPPAPEESDRSKTYAYVGFGVGGALLAGSLVSLILQRSSASTVIDDCPNNRCPTSKQDEVRSATNAASTEGPLALVLGAAGLVGAGVGAYFYFRPSAQTHVGVSPMPGGTLVQVGGAF
jgi:hypothetical protein